MTSGAPMDLLPPKISRKKKILFTGILAATPLLLLVLLEFALRLSQYGGNLDLVVKTTAGGRDAYEINREVARRYFAQSGTLIPEPSEDRFAIHKSARTKRIFCLGESTMAGFPFEFNATAPSFLRDRLRKVFPRDSIEVINVGLSAVGSYVVYDFLQELMKYDPDLFIIYVGHNEFYGVYGAGSAVPARGGPWLTRLTIDLLRFKVFLLIRNVYIALRGLFGHAAPAAQSTLMEQMIGNADIPYRSELYERGRQAYVENLSRIIQCGREHHVPILFSSLVSNLRDQPPFVSEFSPTTSQERRDHWARLVTAGDSAMSFSRYEEAADRYREAVGIDSVNATAYFGFGRALYGSGEYGDALRAFRRARDLDALRFRASSEFQADLISLCRGNGVTVARVDSGFARESPHGIIGHELILEHLHPNVRGYFAMAKVWSDAIQANHLLETAHGPEASVAMSDSTLMVESSVSPFDTTVGRIRIDYLTHRKPFVSQDLPYTFVPSNPVESIALQYVERNVAWSAAKYQVADAYARSGEYDLARRECYGVAKVIPYSYQPLLKIADLYLQERRPMDAMAAYEECVRTQDNPFGRLKIAAMLINMTNRTADAIMQIETALHMSPRGDLSLTAYQRAAALYMEGVAYGKLGQMAKARENLEAALSLEPDFPEARSLLKQIPR